MKATYCNPLTVENVGSGRWLDASLSRLEDPKPIINFVEENFR